MASYRNARVPSERIKQARAAGSVFVVGLLLGRGGNAVLVLGRAGPQPVQAPTVLCVVDVVFKKQLHRK